MVAFFWIPDWPEQNKYLSVADKEMLRQRLRSDQPTDEEDELSFRKLGAILRDWKIWIRYICVPQKGGGGPKQSWLTC